MKWILSKSFSTVAVAVAVVVVVEEGSIALELSFSTTFLLFFSSISSF
jgi:hypothetical protein